MNGTNFFYLSKRLNRAGIKGREAVINLLSILGISFGVLALTVILSVMNGLQSGYINTIMEVSSGHIRLSAPYQSLKNLEAENDTKSFYIFNESQALMQGNYNRQSGALVRAVELENFQKDSGLLQHLSFITGSLSLDKPATIILGYELARALSVSVGDEVVLPLIAGSSDVDMFSENSTLTVTGIFKTGFLAVDSAYSFVSFETGKRIFGEQKNALALVKLRHENSDYKYLAQLKNNYPDIHAESWREYNHAFFGALRVEKNVMTILVVLIFIVVAVNIYNGMRRTIYERREDIAVLASLGMKKERLRFLFFANGFKVGLIGSCTGLVIGLLMAKNINEIFAFVENIINAAASVFLHIIYSKEELPYMDKFFIFSSNVFYMDEVPSAISFFECCYISLFALLSSALASLIATRKILTLKVQEILRYE